MCKTFFQIIVAAFCFSAFFACKKTDNNNNNSNPNSALVDSLKKNCTAPFIGAGDSCTVYLPTAFTPNADGIDDVYWVISANRNFSTFTMNIYDTVGTRVFHSSSASYNWDGTDTTTGKVATQYKFYVEVSYTTANNISVSKGTYVYLLSTAATGCINRVNADTSKYEFPDQFNDSGYNASTNCNETANEVFCN